MPSKSSRQLRGRRTIDATRAWRLGDLGGGRPRRQLSLNAGRRRAGHHCIAAAWACCFRAVLHSLQQVVQPDGRTGGGARLPGGQAGVQVHCAALCWAAESVGRGRGGLR